MSKNANSNLTPHPPHQFQRIGLFAKYNTDSVGETLKKLILFLKEKGFTLSIEEKSATLVDNKICPSTLPREKLGEKNDLVIVVGGDGSLLNAARAIVPFEIPILGINRGNLGFLADILPADMEAELQAILAGNYTEEERILLQATVERNSKKITVGQALNDVVLFSGNVARMIEFEVYINEQFVLRQRSDGLITATPTGSTAYALSGGGPILYPSLHAIALVSMYPHTLSSRPIVVADSSEIALVITPNNDIHPKLSCDGQLHFDLQPGDIIHIHKYEKVLKLIHPAHHNYFAVLREKLGWSTHQIKEV